jgi:hypothetical protein
LVEKWIPPTRLETAEIGQKNSRNFRQDFFLLPTSTFIQISN